MSDITRQNVTFAMVVAIGLMIVVCATAAPSDSGAAPPSPPSSAAGAGNDTASDRTGIGTDSTTRSTGDSSGNSTGDPTGDRVAGDRSTIIVDAAFLERCARAASYSERADGRSMLVMHRGEIIFERYASGVTERSHFELASGTKSFVGVLAVAAMEDGLLDLDERASNTLTEWKDDPTRRDITIRQILTLTSGIGSGRVGRPPTFADAITAKREAPTGSAFIYGPAPFQVFGEILRRKLEAAYGSGGEGVREYAMRRLFTPLGIEIGMWRTGRDGQPHLPSGVSLTARDWAKFGEFVRNGGRVGETQVVASERIAACLLGTDIKPEYGLTWWLAWFDGQGLDPEELLQRGNTRGGAPRTADIWMAAGLGKQRLYVIPSMELVIVRQAGLSRGGSFNDQAFLTMLLDLRPGTRESTGGATGRGLVDQSDRPGRPDRGRFADRLRNRQ